MESPSPVYENLKSTLLGLPVALGITLLCQSIPFFGGLAWYFLQIPIHELGHAWGCWLSGRFAFPIGAIIPMVGFTFWGMERWLPVYFGLAAGFGWLIYAGIRAHTPFAFFLGAIALLVQYRMTWAMPLEKSIMIGVWGGCGGELILSTILILAYFFKLPPQLHWEYLRFPGLVAGTYTFSRSYQLWDSASRDYSKIPMGTFMNGQGDANGDMQRLLTDYGWDPIHLVSSYQNWAKAGLIAIVATYVYCSFRAWRKHRS